MTSDSSHSEHLSRHLKQVRRTLDAAQVDALLEAAGLRAVGGELKTVAGKDLGPDACARYLEAVKRELGDAVYYPARVNFILARCSGVRQDS